MRYLLGFICLALLAIPALAQPAPRQTIVTGRILDSATGEAMRLVTVRVEGTKKGAITNAGGRFLLRLDPGSYSLAISMVGYRTERRTIEVGGDSTHIEVVMHEAPYQVAEVVVSSEDPGMGIMRRAIARKMRQADSLRTYAYTLYTKFVASTDTLTAGRSSGRLDTTIISIFESYSDGYYRYPDAYYNEITQRRQTANVGAGSNLLAFGTNLNAYADHVTILGEEIATPFHPDALGFYEFVLERSVDEDDSVKVQRVRVTPKSEGRRLFSGYIDIDDARSLPRYVELRPNRAVRLPFDAELIYRQTFDEVDGHFVLPTGMHIYGTVEASFLWIFNPRVDINIETVAYGYRCNVPLDDDLFSRRRIELSESAELFDSTRWFQGSVLPLRPEEIDAYEAISLDETPDSARNSGFFGTLLGDIPRAIGRLNRRPFTGLEDIFRYNRIHGAYVGGGVVGDLFPSVEGSLRLGYGTADRRWYGEGLLRYFFDENRRFAITGTAYRRLARRDNPYIVSTSAITAIALLRRIDYGDYYYSTGFETSLEAGFGQLRGVRRDVYIRPTTIRLFARNEDHESASNRATFALLGGDRIFRENPASIPGTLRSFGVELNYDYSPLRRLSDFGFQLGAEISKPSLLPSTFDFEYYYGTMILRTPTLPLWRLDLRLTGGLARGDVPPQRFFSLESSVSSIAGESAFRGMREKEFYGDRFVSLSLEHNFGELVPGILRIPNIASFGLEFILLGKLGWSTFSPRTLAYTGTTLPSTEATGDRFYYEAGLGINRILLFFRFDVSARLSQVEKPRFYLTFSGATL